MNDAQSTIVGLNAQDCPGGGWNGMPHELERATVADCLAHGVCGCIYGDAVQHIERLRAALKKLLDRHVDLVESGDCGFWNVNEESEVRQARIALGITFANEQSAPRSTAEPGKCVHGIKLSEECPKCPKTVSWNEGGI